MQPTYLSIRTYLESLSVTLIAVSKTRPVEALMELYTAGQRDFAENRVQEMRDKQAVMPGDIRWHMIGHLQRNKVKYIAPWIHMIHSVDNLALLEEINRQAAKAGRVIPCLLQICIAAEETKFGLYAEELHALLQSSTFQAMRHVRICGLMGMATNTDNLEQVRREFKHLKSLFDMVQAQYFPGDPNYRHISMGMSSDYRIAVEEGSTMVRIGSLLFNKA